jgi:hypothetical protein
VCKPERRLSLATGSYFSCHACMALQQQTGPQGFGGQGGAGRDAGSKKWQLGTALVNAAAAAAACNGSQSLVVSGDAMFQ